MNHRSALRSPREARVSMPDDQVRNWKIVKYERLVFYMCYWRRNGVLYGFDLGPLPQQMTRNEIAARVRQARHFYRREP